MEKLSEQLRKLEDEAGLRSRDNEYYRGKENAYDLAADLAEAYEAEVEKRIAELTSERNALRASIRQPATCEVRKPYEELHADYLIICERVRVEVKRAEKAEHEEKKLQSQLAWTPVSDGLPTEEEETVLVRQSRMGGHIYGLLWFNGTSLLALTEEQPCGLYEYGSSGEVIRDWDEFRRITLPERET